MNKSNKLLSDIVAFRTYAKYLPHVQRRESLEETINRSMHMDLDKFPKLSKEIINAYSFVHDLKIMPSMRKMQFAGEAIVSNNIRQYNCSFTNMTKPRKFSEILFLLLSGTGVGYSVQNKHVSQLPIVKKPREEYYYRVHDSIEGWASALDVLMNAFFFRQLKPQFDFSAIRPKGSYLVTTGAKAPGPEPLAHMLKEVEKILVNAIGRKLMDIEVHDLNCIIADCVLAGGIRRAALIALFDKDSEQMLKCKSGSWWEKYPYRARANNSAVLHRAETTEEEFWEVFNACKNSGSGEPGIFWTNDYNIGTNPSLRKGTRVVTDSGVFPIEELQDKEFEVPNLDGRWSKARCWLSGKDISLWELTLETGEKYYASPEHKWPIYVNGRYVKCESKDLREGDLLPINVFTREGLLKQSSGIGTREEGFLIGWLYGSGSITTEKDTGKDVYNFVVSEKDGKSILEKLMKEVEKIDGINDRKENHRGHCWEFQVSSEKFREWIKKFSVVKKQFGLPSKMWTEWSEDCRRGLIDGLFSSDGHVPKDSRGISLVSSKEKLIKDVQDLLGFYGIKSSLTNKKTNDRTVGFPNRKTNDKVYDCYRLRTTVNGRIRFSELFELSVDYKNEELQRKFKLKQEFVRLKEIKLTEMKEDVWDISVFDDTHCFQLPQVTTGNCAEISLRPDQFCNLTTTNLTGVDNEKEFMKRIYATTVLGTIQASYTDYPFLEDSWKQNSEEEALLGVSFTGIADAATFVTPELLKQGALYVLEINEKIAKKIGINLAARTTTVKPEGSSSTIFGSSSGIHDRHSEYYIRRVRMNKDDALAKYLMDNIPQLVEDEKFSKTGVVVSIPIESPPASITRHQSTAKDLFFRAMNYNKNWIAPGHRSGVNKHNVSVTISVKDEEWQEIGELMWKHRKDYAGISLLPFDGGTYVQAPFEDITKEKYDELTGYIKNLDLRQVIEVEDFTDRSDIIACAGGACTVEF